MRIIETDISTCPVLIARDSRPPGDCRDQASLCDVSNGVVVGIADVDVVRNIESYPKRHIESGRAAKPVVRTGRSRQTSQGRNLAGRSNLANCFSKGVSHVNISRTIQCESARVREARGTPCAIDASHHSRQASQGSDQAGRGYFANRMIQSVRYKEIA